MHLHMTRGLSAWKAEGNGGDLAQALNSKLWGFLEAAKSVLGGGPSQEDGVGARKQNPLYFHPPTTQQGHRLGRELGGAQERGSVS